MKILKLIIIVFLLVLTVACFGSPKERDIVNSNFPLKQEQVVFSSEDGIRRIAAGNTWIAIYSAETITAIDIDFQKTLWQMSLVIRDDLKLGFVMIDEKLIVVSGDQIFSIDKQGIKRKMNVNQTDNGILGVVSVDSNYLYVILSDWGLEAYDVSNNEKLWTTTPLSRGYANVIYDLNKNASYVSTEYNGFYQIDNSTGHILFKSDINSLYSVFDDGKMYGVTESDESTFIFFCYDVENQKNLWSQNISFGDYAYSLTTVDGLLIAGSDDGLLAIDKNSGLEVWRIELSEAFHTAPVEFDDVIYIKGDDLHVYAISYTTGEIIGFLDLEDVDLITPTYELLSGVYEIENAILLNTRNAVLLYK